MIAVLVCYCPTAEPKAYRFLQSRIGKWMEVPVYRGKAESEKFLRDFEGYPPDDRSPQGLSKHIGRVGKFVVIVGYNDNEFGWSDIANNDAKAEIDAEIILERFA